MPIAENLERLHEQIAAACSRAGRAREEVALMAVSKVHGAEVIVEAYAAGQRLFGENRVQEFAGKLPKLAALPEARYHLIGPLQSNKTTKAAELFHSVDTLDSGKTANRLNTAAAARGAVLPVLVEVKLSHEESKHGIAPAALPALLRELAALPHLLPTGLMTVPPWSEDGEQARPYFRELRRLRDLHAVEFPLLRELSMGMSNDFPVAIEEGSTTVRVGTALFGRRPRSIQQLPVGSQAAGGEPTTIDADGKSPRPFQPSNAV